MATVIYKRAAGTGLTPEELASLEEAERLPQVYDEDCPKLTPGQIAQFRPVNFATMEERAEAMRHAGGFDGVPGEGNAREAEPAVLMAAGK